MAGSAYDKGGRRYINKVETMNMMPRIGEVAQRLYDAITTIQYACVPDTRGWMAPVGS